MISLNSSIVETTFKLYNILLTVVPKMTVKTNLLFIKVIHLNLLAHGCLINFWLKKWKKTPLFMQIAIGHKPELSNNDQNHRSNTYCLWGRFYVLFCQVTHRKSCCLTWFNIYCYRKQKFPCQLFQVLFWIQILMVWKSELLLLICS